MTVEHRSDGSNSQARHATPAELEAAGMDHVTAVLAAAKGHDDPAIAAMLAELEASQDRESAVFREALEDLARMLERPDVPPPEQPQAGGAAVQLGRIEPAQRVDVGAVPAPFVAGAGIQVQHLGRVATHMNQAGISVQHVGGRREDPTRATLREAVDVATRVVTLEHASGALKSAADALLEQAQIELRSMHETP